MKQRSLFSKKEKKVPKVETPKGLYIPSVGEVINRAGRNWTVEHVEMSDLYSDWLYPIQIGSDNEMERITLKEVQQK